MSHFTVLVVTGKDDPKDIEEKLYPFWELDLNPEEMRADPRSEFKVNLKKEDIPEKLNEISEKVDSWLAEYTEDLETLETALSNSTDFNVVNKSLNNPVANWDLNLSVQFSKATNGEKLVAAVRASSKPFEEFSEIKSNYEKWLEEGKVAELLEDWGAGIKNADGDFGFFCNPNAKWDWYQVGGRWSGKLTLKDGSSRDSAKVKALSESCLASLSTFAVLDKEGTWHENGSMGWFGCSSFSQQTVNLPSMITEELVENEVDSRYYSKEYVQTITDFVEDFYTFNSMKKLWELKEENDTFELSKENKASSFVNDLVWKLNYKTEFLSNLDPEDTLTIVDCHI